MICFQKQIPTSDVFDESKSTYEEFLEMQKTKSQKSKSLERDGATLQTQEKPKTRKFSFFSKSNNEEPSAASNFQDRPGFDT